MQVSLNGVQKIKFGLKWDPVSSYRIDINNRSASTYDLDLCALVITKDNKRIIIDYIKKNWNNQVKIVKDSIEGDYRKISEQIDINSLHNINKIYIGIVSINSKVRLKDINNLSLKIALDNDVFTRDIKITDKYGTAFIASEICETQYGMDYKDIDEVLEAHTSRELFKRVGWTH